MKYTANVTMNRVHRGVHDLGSPGQHDLSLQMKQLWYHNNRGARLKEISQNGTVEEVHCLYGMQRNFKIPQETLTPLLLLHKGSTDLLIA